MEAGGVASGHNPRTLVIILVLALKEVLAGTEEVVHCEIMEGSRWKSNELKLGRWGLGFRASSVEG